MSYKVIHFFTDLQDFNRPYNVGDKFPHEGHKVSQERLNELASRNNKQGKPLIVKVDDVKVEKKVEPVVEKNIEDVFAKSMNAPTEGITCKYNKTEINRMSTNDLKKFAKESNIEKADSMSGYELKKILIKKYNL